MGMTVKQWKFVRMLRKLVDFAEAKGYMLTLGDGYRDPRVHGALGESKGYGHPKSNHKLRLAQDYNLFNAATGEWLTDTEDFRPLGEFWESLDPECAWGGHFGDGNHFSFRHNGTR